MPRFLQYDNILCFYLGRNETGPSPVAHIKGNWVDLDWNWGVCNYVVYQGDCALVVDTQVYPDHALWIRQYLEEIKGIKKLTVASSHWHLDHIAGNEHFADCNIIATKLCREEMMKIKDSVETATFWGEPPLKMVLPDITYENDLTFYVGDIEVQAHRFHIHTPDSVAFYLPQFDIMLCSDMLEDTCPFVLDVDDLAIQRKELLRMKMFEAKHFFPNHGDPAKIKTGGYGSDFIDAVMEYEYNLVAMRNDPHYADLPVEAFAPNAFAEKTITVWHYYEKVHEDNKKLVMKRFAD